MLLVHRIAYKLMGTPAALLAVLATPASLGAMKQMRIMRIDHHGWQIVLALAAMLAVLDERPRRSGIVAGAAMALWCNISIEALPFVAALGAWFAFQWLADGAAGERLKSYLAALAGASLLLFGADAPPSVWLAHPHDVLNVAHLAGFTIAAVCCHFVIRDDDLRRPSSGLARACGGSALPRSQRCSRVDPHFLQGPFSSLDPLVAVNWYQGVDEGMPVWRLAPAATSPRASRSRSSGCSARGSPSAMTEGEQRKGWIAFAYLLGAVTLSAVFVIREATTASTLSLPGTGLPVRSRAAARARRCPWRRRGSSRPPARCSSWPPLMPRPALVMPADPRLVNAMNRSDYCLKRSQIEKLERPAGEQPRRAARHHAGDPRQQPSPRDRQRLPPQRRRTSTTSS